MAITAYPLLLLALATLAGAADSSPALNQTEAQRAAEQTQNRGSDDSLESSYGNALNALDSISHLNLPGAVKSGWKAYGQYRNSQTMDDLQARGQANANQMGGGQAPAPAKAGKAYVSPYERLDRKFLRQGETAKVAARLEAYTGISREKMFRMAVEIHSKSKSINDPGFVSWAMGSYQDTVKNIPNPDARATFEKFGETVSGMIKSGETDAILKKFRSRDAAPAAPAPAPSLAAIPEAAGPAAPPAAENPAEAPASAETAAPSPGLDKINPFDAPGAVVRGSADMEKLKYEPVTGYLGGLMQMAGGGEADSLFLRVSRKIRQRTREGGL